MSDARWWWCTPLAPALGRRGRRVSEIEGSLGQLGLQSEYRTARATQWTLLWKAKIKRVTFLIISNHTSEWTRSMMIIFTKTDHNQLELMSHFLFFPVGRYPCDNLYISICIWCPSKNYSVANRCCLTDAGKYCTVLIWFGDAFKNSLSLFFFFK